MYCLQGMWECDTYSSSLHARYPDEDLEIIVVDGGSEDR